MKLGAKKIMIVFDNEDRWEVACESGIRFDDAMRMIAKAWKEYDEPKEPLINDEPTAKFVRAWMKHWEIEKVRARMLMSHGVELIGWKDDSRGREIDIQAAFVSGEIEDGHEYTINELCGEEGE